MEKENAQRIEKVAKLLCRSSNSPYSYLACKNCVLDGSCEYQKGAKAIVEAGYCERDEAEKSVQVIEEKDIYRFKASLKHICDEETFEVAFNVLAEDIYKAQSILEEWLKDPKQTGFKFECCVGITREPSGRVLVKEEYVNGTN